MAFIHDDASYQVRTLETIMNGRLDGGLVNVQILWTSESTDSFFELALTSPFSWDTSVPAGLQMVKFSSNIPSGVLVHIPAFRTELSSPEFNAFVTNTTGSDQLCSTVVTYEVL